MAAPTLTEVNAKVDTNKGDIAAVKATADAAKAKDILQDTKIGENKAKDGTQDTAIAGVKATADAAKAKDLTQDTAIHDVKVTADAAKAKDTLQDTKIGENKAKDGTQDTAISAVKHTADANKAKDATQDTKIGEVKSTADAAKATNTSQDTKIGENKAKDLTQDTKIGEVKSVADAAKATNASQDTTIAGIKVTADAAKAKNASQDAIITDAKSIADGAKATADAAKATADANKLKDGTQDTDIAAAKNASAVNARKDGTQDLAIAAVKAIADASNVTDGKQDTKIADIAHLVTTHATQLAALPAASDFNTLTKQVEALTKQLTKVTGATVVAPKVVTLTTNPLAGLLTSSDEAAKGLATVLSDMYGLILSAGDSTDSNYLMELYVYKFQQYIKTMEVANITSSVTKLLTWFATTEGKVLTTSPLVLSQATVTGEAFDVLEFIMLVKPTSATAKMVSNYCDTNVELLNSIPTLTRDAIIAVAKA